MSDLRCNLTVAQVQGAGGRSNNGCPRGLGSLPACGSLATPFVPSQGSGADTYPNNKALEEGSLFQDLNLPFHLKVNAPDLADNSLNRLSAAGFVLHELGLYLDTHPYDKEALAMFQNVQEHLKTLRAEYVAEHGPLTMADAMEKGNYTWWKGPWPWQYPGEEA